MIGTKVLLNSVIGKGFIASGAVPPPTGSIALWSGTLITIPVNWALCDGTGVTPNLVAKFIRGAPAATDPGTTGGANSHTHASMTSAGGHTHTLAALTHSHTVTSLGNHNHNSSSAGLAGSGAVPCMVGHIGGGDVNYGAHQHTNNTGSHTHSTDSQGGHTHSITTDDDRPPYYEVAYIQAAAGAVVSANLIIIWSGLLAAVPAGWTLCNGSGGRPDLRGKFIRGVNTSITNPGTTGGNTTHNHTEGNAAAHGHTTVNATAHKHTFSAYTWTHTHNLNANSGASAAIQQTDASAGDHTHADSDTIDTHNHEAFGNSSTHTNHSVNTASSLPAYYDIAYIFNDGGATVIPASGIIIWTGLLINIPVGYSLCDGTGATPDLRAKFIRGSDAGVDPGGTGGANTHTHTEVAAGSHTNHTQTSLGNHQHAATNSIGSHSHTTSAQTILNTGADPNYESAQVAAGAHSHNYNSEGAHSNHTVSDPGTHNHQPWSTDDGKPAYYEVAFISKA